MRSDRHTPSVAICGVAALALAYAPPAWAEAANAAAEEAAADAATEGTAGETDTAGAADTTATDPIFVFGRGEKRIGIAGAASEGGVAGADIEIRPL
ncbi:MAG TPA: TonB-dependent receptor, partial [Croceibacterium sp.]|nr:TonB-dependent receptor [Croceibacterium sp.]